MMVGDLSSFASQPRRQSLPDVQSDFLPLTVRTQPLCDEVKCRRQDSCFALHGCKHCSLAKKKIRYVSDRQVSFFIISSNFVIHCKSRVFYTAVCHCTVLSRQAFIDTVQALFLESSQLDALHFWWHATKNVPSNYTYIFIMHTKNPFKKMLFCTLFHTNDPCAAVKRPPSR